MKEYVCFIRYILTFREHFAAPQLQIAPIVPLLSAKLSCLKTFSHSLLVVSRSLALAA